MALYSAAEFMRFFLFLPQYVTHPVFFRIIAARDGWSWSMVFYLPMLFSARNYYTIATTRLFLFCGRVLAPSVLLWCNKGGKIVWKSENCTESLSVGNSTPLLSVERLRYGRRNLL